MTELLLLAATPVDASLLLRSGIALVVGLVLYCGLAEPGQGWGGGAPAVARRLGFAVLGALVLFALTDRGSAATTKPRDGEGKGFNAYTTGVLNHRLSLVLPDSIFASARSQKTPLPREIALKELKSAVEQVPESAHFKRYLAIVQAEHRDFSGALNTINAAMQIVRKRAPDRALVEQASWQILYGPEKPTPEALTAAGKELENLGLGWLARAATLSAYRRPDAPPPPPALRERVIGEAASYVIGLFGAGILTLFVVPALGLIILIVGGMLIRSGVLRPIPGFSHPVAAPLLESFILMLSCMVLLPVFIAVGLGGSRPTPETQPALYSALLVAGDFFQIPVVGYLALRLRAKGLSLAEIGLSRQHLGANLLIGVLAALVIMPTAQILALATQHLSDRFFPNVAPPYHPLGGITATNTHPAVRAALFFAAAIGAPIFEEIFFRGALFGSLRRRFRFWPSALISSAFFAILHPQLPLGFIPIAALAIGFAALTEWRRSLVPGMVAHAVNNSLAFLMMSLLFPPSG